MKYIPKVQKGRSTHIQMYYWYPRDRICLGGTDYQLHLSLGNVTETEETVEAIETVQTVQAVGAEKL